MPASTNDTMITAFGFGFVALVILVALIANYWYRLRIKQWEMSLKHSMIERGMSAEEIKIVLDAAGKESPPRQTWRQSPRGGSRSQIAS